MTETVHGAACWRIRNDSVTVAVTCQGAHMAPVVFRLGGREVSPYALAPWQPDEADAGLPHLLKVLRGDFFCLPFGPQDNGPPHGTPANERWELWESGDDWVELGLEASDSGASLIRRIELREGETTVYQQLQVSGLEGEWSYGNHPILDFSGLAEGSGQLSVSPFRWGSVYPGVFSDPERDESQALLPGGRFSDLRKVPTADGGETDVGSYPSRQGFEDLVMMVSEPATAERPFAWSAAVMDGYLWFSLKNPEDFPATLFWLSNGGRRGAPWSGKHLGRVGIEEVCSYFCDGVEDSRADHLSADGVPTTRRFSPGESVRLRVVQGVVELPGGGFGRVASILPDGPGRVEITDEAGMTAKTLVDWAFIQ